MSFWPDVDGDSTAYVQQVIINTDIPDDAKREVLEALDLREPDNGMRLTIDVQYKFDANINDTSACSFGFMYFLRAAIQDYQKKFAENYADGQFANKAIKDIAFVNLLDIEYCDAWVEEESEDG